MPQQIRFYTIKEGELETFAHEWRRGIRPLREALGFKIVSAWTLAAKCQFVWVLEHSAEDWTDLDARYHASPERKALKPNPARLIEKAEAYFLEVV